MIMSATVITKPKVEIAPDLLKKIKEQSQLEGQVILHFIYTNLTFYPGLIRIWPTSYLFDRDSEHQSNLVHVEKITMYPTWQEVHPLTNTYFTLVFSKLPKACEVFDFVEICGGQGGGFEVKDIERNETDVYYLRLV